MEDLNWSTQDFYSAVIVRASGLPLSKLTVENAKFVTFHFNSNPEDCEKILKQHWDRNLHLETRLFIETLKELKTRIHEKLKGSRYG